MPNPIVELLAALGGGAEASQQYSDRQRGQNRADAEERRKQALEALTQQKMLDELGAKPMDPTNPRPGMTDSALTASVGVTPQAPSAVQALALNNQTPIATTRNPLTGDATGTTQGALPASPSMGPGPSAAISALANATAPKAPLVRGQVGESMGAAPETFSVPDFNGRAQQFYKDPNETTEAKRGRVIQGQQEAMYGRQSKLEQAKLDQKTAVDQAAWKGDFDTLKRVGYFTPDVTFVPGHNYTRDWEDYKLQTGEEGKDTRADKRAAAMQHGASEEARLAREADQERQGLAYIQANRSNPQFAQALSAVLNTPKNAARPGLAAYSLMSGAGWQNKQADVVARTEATQQRAATSKAWEKVLTRGDSTPPTPTAGRGGGAPTAQAQPQAAAGTSVVPPNAAEWDALASKYGAERVTKSYGPRPAAGP